MQRSASILKLPIKDSKGKRSFDNATTSTRRTLSPTETTEPHLYQMNHSTMFSPTTNNTISRMGSSKRLKALQEEVSTLRITVETMKSNEDKMKDTIIELSKQLLSLN
jgi:chaperonin cofactor prefoldin